MWMAAETSGIVTTPSKAVGSFDDEGSDDMDLFDVARSCFRRWYVFLPLLLIVGWFSYSVYSSVKPVYYSNAVIGIAPPSTRVDNVAPGVPLPRNGLLDIGGASLIANMTALGLREPVGRRSGGRGRRPARLRLQDVPGPANHAAIAAHHDRGHRRRTRLRSPRRSNWLSRRLR